jgi:hypothetical protein
VDEPSLPQTLVLHDGDLGDVCALMGRLALAFQERRGGARPEDTTRRWDVVIANPRRMLEFRSEALGSDPSRIAVLERDSTTLRAMLGRAGIDLVVRRPVHPAALRLLILHCLYRGPERRRSPRVSVGAPVRCRIGLRRRDAILAELSLTGCRVLSPFELEPGRKIALQLPSELAGGRGFQVDGTVLRMGASQMEGMHTVAVSFRNVSKRTHQKLVTAVEAHAGGPAVLSGAAAPTLAELQPDGSRGGAGAGPGDEDRRASPRHEYLQRVIALGAEAGRVLMGRDLSLGGMRVDAHPDLHVGDQLSIGLHLRAREKPLIVRAQVVRSDEQKGFALAFHELSVEAESYLRSMIDFLPILSVHEGDVDAGVMPAEILEHTAARVR